MTAYDPRSSLTGPFSRDREPLSRGARRALLLASHNISFVIDAGGWEGEYGLTLRQAGFDGRICSFEPMAVSFAKLEAMAASDPNWDVYPVALGRNVGKATLNVAHDSQCNSFLAVEPRSVDAAPESEFIATEAVRIERLDQMWNRIVPSDVAPYLKLDVQGYELEVLQGAGQYLATVAMVEVELSLVPVYNGGPLWREVVDYLDVRGFRLVSVENIFEDIATGEMLQVDGIFTQG